ncbi:MAG: cyclopropane-fatty-acyl-phospholipid synthase family protein [Nitrospirota bacterium]|jgi:cyclopropane-fatty-acyl-phospholipid synthase
MNANLDCATAAFPRPTSVASRILLRVFDAVEYGRLELTTPEGSRRLRAGIHPGPDGSMVLRRPWRLLGRLARRGEIGLAEGFMAGDWWSPDPAALLEVLALNERELAEALPMVALQPLLGRLRHRLRPNTRRGSRRNIAAHYDLGNDFFHLWLDETLSYSGAVFGHPDEPLAVAQARKYQRLLDLLEARPGQHLLEIGCGWGGFALHAARQGLRVTGITLSREQMALARRRVAEAGLAGRVSIHLLDYRDLRGRFDHIVSIEMFEAVGEPYWPTYFATLRRRLRPGGRAAVQTITIDEDAFSHYRRSADFIQLYIFPGGLLPTVTRFRAAAEAAGLQLRDRAMFGADYACTLRRWHEAVRARAVAIRALGYDERFLRMWRYYLAYCEAGFRTGRVDLMQAVLEGPA